MKKIIVLFLILAAQTASAQYIMTGEGGGSSGGGGDGKPELFLDPSNNQWTIYCDGKGFYACPKKTPVGCQVSAGFCKEQK